MQNQGGQRMPNIGQMQHIFLEGMRPELAYLNYSQRQPQPQAQLQRTFTIRNDVNLKKNSLKMVQDAASPHLYHLEFVFDAATECSITVHYAATEVTGEARARFTPLKEGSSHPKEYRPKGLGQTFRTRPENALDLTAFAPEELKYEASAARFPVVVRSPPISPDRASIRPDRLDRLDRLDPLAFPRCTRSASRRAAPRPPPTRRPPCSRRAPLPC